MSTIISKKKAKELGLKKYYTGKPCKHGHYSERYISGHCLGCATLHMKSYHDDNRDSIRANNKAYMQKRLEDSPKLRKKMNKARVQWAKDNPHKAAEANMRRRARKRSQTPELTSEQSKAIKLTYYKAWCYSQVEQWTFHVDHIIALVNGGLHHPDNLQVLEASANCSKGAS